MNKKFYAAFQSKNDNNHVIYIKSFELHNIITSPSKNSAGKFTRRDISELLILLATQFKYLSDERNLIISIAE